MDKSYIIYKIINLEDGRQYFGSTSLKIKKRIRIHKRADDCSCSNFDWDNVKVEELEFLYCDKEQARIIEEEYRENNECVNMVRAYMSEERRKELNRKKSNKYANKNREVINEKQRNKKITCECGCEMNSKSIKSHKLSRKHLRRILNS